MYVFFFQFDVSQMILIIGLSTFLTLLVDIPFQKIGKYVTEGVLVKN